MGNKFMKRANVTKEDQMEKKSKTSKLSIFGKSRKSSKVNHAEVINAQPPAAELKKCPLRILRDLALRTKVPIRFHLVIPRSRCPGCSPSQQYIIQAQYMENYGVGMGTSKKEALTKASADLVKIMKLQ